MKTTLVTLLAINAILTQCALQADLINVGDTQTITLDAEINGDPKVNPSWGVPINVTAGTYHFQ